MLEVLCRAKLNLTLEVLRRRSDGYHDLDSVFASVSLADCLVVERRDGGVMLRCGDPSIPSGLDNLAYRAAQAFLMRTGLRLGVGLALEKRIPMSAGLGGGSSNAAGTLLALNELTGSPLDGAELRAVAASLGSDVPYSLVGGLARAQGRGEVLTPLGDGRGPSSSGQAAPAAGAPPPLWFVLVKPPFGVSTAWAYSQVDPRGPGAGRSEAMVRALQAGDPTCIGALLCNDLQPAVFRAYPELPALRDALLRAGSLGALMSGSGSTIFGLFADEGSARRAASTLPQEAGAVFVTHTTARALEIRRAGPPAGDGSPRHSTESAEGRGPSHG